MEVRPCRGLMSLCRRAGEGAGRGVDGGYGAGVGRGIIQII